MLVLNTATSAKAEGKGIEGGDGEGSVTLSGSMTRQVSFEFRMSCPIRVRANLRRLRWITH